MGQGMALITPDPERVLKVAKKYGVEARIAGEVTGEGGISIVSRGAEKPGQELRFM